MPQFYPANPKTWAIGPYSIYNALQLAWSCRVDLHPESISILKSLPANSSVILVSNHADEMDIRVHMEVARRAGRRFKFMVNAEAFEEMGGFAGYWMTRVGCFSVERGAGDSEARAYALETLRKSRETLVMFPEGEIYYLNDQVQPFKTGAVLLGFEALREIRQRDPKASVYIVPAALKYHYTEAVSQKLWERLWELEERFKIKPHTLAMQERLTRLMKLAAERYGIKNLSAEKAAQWTKISEDIQHWRSTMLTRLEAKYKQIWGRPARHLMDRAYKLTSQLREQMDQSGGLDGKQRREMRRDLKVLKRTVWFASWSPQYHEKNPSLERLAEGVIKLEREILGNPRPKPLGARRVAVTIGTPVDLSEFAEEYTQDSKAVCRRVTDHLQSTIQNLIERSTPGRTFGAPENEYTNPAGALNLHVLAEDGQKVFLDHYRSGHKKAVVIAHGFFNSKSSVLIRRLADALKGIYDVVILDFRGHGQSPGLFYWTTKEYLDLEAVLNYMKPQYESIGLIGFSLGAATSIITASRSDLVQSLIAISPPTEFEKIEYHFWELDPEQDIFYNLVGDGRYGKGVRPGPFWMKKDKPINCIDQVKAPILFIHGTKDWLIKPVHSIQLCDAAKSRKRIELISDGPHAEYLLLKNYDATVNPILEWLQETL